MADEDSRPGDQANRRQQHPPPAYDPMKTDYTGISAGVIDSLKDIQAARDFAEMIVDTVREGLLVLDFDCRVQAANESFYHMFNVRPEDTVGNLVYDLGHRHWDIPELRDLLEQILPFARVMDDYEVEHDFLDVGRRVLMLNARRMDDHQLILLAIEDVTERRQDERDLRALNETLEARVKERTQQVRDLSQALALAEQKERQRIAYLLHEDLQQVLFGAKMVAPKEADNLDRMLDKAIALTRTLSYDLSPPFLQEVDVTAILRWVAERQQEQHGLEVEVETVERMLVEDLDLRVLVYQSVRELLFNVVKHAQATRARLVAAQVDGHLRITVEDDGVGFDHTALEESGATGLGLPSIRERLEMAGGFLEVMRGDGRGTRMTVAVPVSHA